MPDYKSMYYQMAARVADAIDLLTKAQQDGEERAMEETRIVEIPPNPERESESNR